MARRPEPLDWEYEVIGRRYRVGQEHPGYPGWYFSGQYSYDGRALWTRPETAVERTRRLVLLIVLWSLGVAGATLLASLLFGSILPAIFNAA